MSKSLGELRVRADSNVSANNFVDVLKKRSAELIDLVDQLKKQTAAEVENGVAKFTVSNDPEQLRLIALAQTAYEEAAMWAVKAATF